MSGDTDFVVKNGLLVNNALHVNSTALTFGNTSSNIAVNSTVITVGTNTFVNSSAFSIGNSSVNAYYTISGVYINGTLQSFTGGSYLKGNYGVYGDPSFANNLFRINSNTISNNIYIAPGENSQVTGPVTIGDAYTLTIDIGGRIVII